jgi:DME family drug/metabolite transporter
VGLVIDSWSGITEAELGPAVGLGVTLAIGSGVSIATYTVAATRLMEDGMGQLPLTAAAYLVGAALLLPVAVTQPRAWVGEPSGIAVGVYLAVATMALANLFYLRGLARLRPGPTATLTLMDPVVAGLLGVLVLRERPAGAAYVGFALVLVGLGVQAWASATRGEEALPAVG